MDPSGVFEAQLVVPWRVRRPRCTRSREIRPAPSLHRASTDALIHRQAVSQNGPLSLYKVLGRYFSS